MIINQKTIRTIKLENSLKLVRKKSLRNDQVSLSDMDIQFRGNYWSLSDTSISADKFIDVEELNKPDDNKNYEEGRGAIAFWVGASFLLLMIVGFTVIFYCIFTIGSKDEDFENEVYNSPMEQSLLTANNTL